MQEPITDNHSLFSIFLNGLYAYFSNIYSSRWKQYVISVVCWIVQTYSSGEIQMDTLLSHEATGEEL